MNHYTLGVLLIAAASTSCKSTPERTPLSSSAQKSIRNDKLGGTNTLSQVTVVTTGSAVGVAGTTVDGRRVRGGGRNLDQALEGVGNSAQRSQ